MLLAFVRTGGSFNAAEMVDSNAVYPSFVTPLEVCVTKSNGATTGDNTGRVVRYPWMLVASNLGVNNPSTSSLV